MANTGKRAAQRAIREAKRDEMQHLYVNTKMSIPEIANRFQVSPSEVSRMADERDLPLRNRWGAGKWQKIRNKKLSGGATKR